MDYSRYVCLMGWVGDVPHPVWGRLGGPWVDAHLVVAYNSSQRGMAGMQLEVWGHGHLGQLRLLECSRCGCDGVLKGVCFQCWGRGECCIDGDFVG